MGWMRKIMTIALAVGLALAVPLTGSGTAEEGEIWVTAQDAAQIKIVHGFGSVETISLPTGSGPHSVNFSPSGTYAYVAQVGNGDLTVIRAAEREVVATLDLGGAGTHQAKPSPDGSFLFVAQIPTKTLVKIAANEAGESWTDAASLTLANTPICTAFNANGTRAYVSVQPSGIRIIDTAAMTLVGSIATDGAVQCGLANSKDGETIYVSSNGSGGKVYRLDTSTDTLTATGHAPGASDLHGFATNPAESWGFASSRGDDTLEMFRLACTCVRTVALDPRPGIADRPDQTAVKGDNVYVVMRASGKLAVVNASHGTVRWIDLATPSSNALHGVAIRP